MDLKKIRQEAKNALFTDLEVILLFAVMFLIVVAASSAAGRVIPYVGFLVAVPLQIGVFFTGIDILSNRKINFMRLFDGYKDINHAFKYALTYLLYSLLVSIGFILFIIPGFYFALKYSQALFLMAEDKNLDIFAAFKKSGEMMEGHKTELLSFYFSFIGWFLLSILTFGLGFLILTPYVHLSGINYYRYLTKKDYIEL